MESPTPWNYGHYGLPVLRRKSTIEDDRPQGKDRMVVRHDPKLTENVIFHRTIANFKKLYAVAKAFDENPIIRFPFTAGKSIGVPTGFEIHLLQNGKDEEEDVLGVNLIFLGSDICKGKYTLSFKSTTGDGDLKYKIKKIGNPYSLKTLAEFEEGGFLSNGQMNLSLEVDISFEGTLISATETHLKRDLSLDFKNALESGSGTDVTFIFVEEGSKNVVGKIAAHKLVLSWRSPVFATMFGSGMKEAKDGKVEISDMSPNAFRILLKFLYSGEVDPEWGDVVEELIYGADLYDLKLLQKYLCENIDSVLDVKNVMKIMDLAKLYNLPNKVLKSTMEFIRGNLEDFVANHDINFKQN